jgi:mannitol/fructose-specific phosphotransferase system IIA component (Ntr-type)
MRFFDFLIKEATIPDLQARDKESVIAELLQAMVKAKAIKKENYKKLLPKIFERETQGSTGIGKGLAVPHVKRTKYVDRMVGVFGRCKHGIDYGAIDAAPCQLFFLLLTPEEANDKHLIAIKKIAKLARNADFCRFMIEARNLKEIVELLEEVDTG